MVCLFLVFWRWLEDWGGFYVSMVVLFVNGSLVLARCTKYPSIVRVHSKNPLTVLYEYE